MSLRRHRLMVEVNRAYEAGDEERLNTILREWQRSPESVKDEGVGAELIRIIRKIAQAEERIAAIDAEIHEMEDSELSQLKDKVETAEDEGRNLLSEMAEELDEEITNAKAEGYTVLVKLIRKLGAEEGSIRGSHYEQ